MLSRRAHTMNFYRKNQFCLYKNRRKQSGISLVEVLVSLVISLFLLGGIIQVFLGNKATHKFSSALSQVQENGRFAMDAISRDLRSAGDWGCINFNPTDATTINNTTINNINNNLVGEEGYIAAIHDFIANSPIVGTNDIDGVNTSDTITLTGSKPGQVNVRAPFSATTMNYITTNSISFFADGDIALITRCGSNDLLIPQEADIFRVTSVDTSANRLNHTVTLSQQYENDATIMELQTVAYSIEEGASGEPALFRSLFNDNQEFIEGVENMQILYGIDTTSDAFANQYVTANNVANFRNVVSVRVMLLVRSFENFVIDQAQTYTFNGNVVMASDRRIRRVFTNTIALRNRIGIL
jgi:type IV pilus assembly protein PilW